MSTFILSYIADIHRFFNKFCNEHPCYLYRKTIYSRDCTLLFDALDFKFLRVFLDIAVKRLGMDPALAEQYIRDRIYEEEHAKRTRAKRNKKDD